MHPSRLLPILCILAVAASLAAQNVPVPNAVASGTPVVTGTLAGPRQAVLVTPRDSCDPNDVPDAMARAFRDSTGTVHLLAASTDLYQDLGPSLDQLTRSCDAAFRSANNTNPADFNDQDWLTSFYTLDGKHVAALTHTEYHGWAIQGECHVQGNSQYTACEYDSDTYHQSNDGGYHFVSFKTPKNFLAGVPYKYRIDDGPAGYSVDTNVIELGGWYYAVATAWDWPPNCYGTTGPHRCLTSGGAPLRTQNVFDPSSWRGWDGKEFSVTFVDPYPGPVSNPQQHVYTPVPYMGYVNAINLYQANGQTIVVATLWDGWDNSLGPEKGAYLTTSTDLVNWTQPQLLASLAELSAHDPKGSWLYAYFSLLDPSAPDMNFSTIGDTPYLYYVRLNNNGPGRVLYRQPVKLTAGQ